ncbi:MAG: 3-phosphoshikimate 1-carboxyvinyltransferase [Fibrobacteres bacterium]|nr:3-phosphoshikimate 1-carboxyvinyltransferase [Fibrobacterota bacterium]
MKIRVRNSSLKGELRIPPSKSHTIRAICLAALSKGTSVIHHPLKSEDTLACLAAVQKLGAKLEDTGDTWKITGFAGKPIIPESPIDLKNSGTSMNFLIAIAALGEGEIELTGDESLCRRPVQHLLDAVHLLGASRAESLNNNGKPPVIIRGRMNGGSATIEGETSQWVSALLMTAPLMRKGIDLKVVRFNERPYVDMTLGWLKKMGISFTRQGRNNFEVPGGQSYFGFESAIPGDFSTATFPLIGALLCKDSSLLIKGLDMKDTQGDKRVFDIVKEMGGNIVNESGALRVSSSPVEGFEIDLNEIPDSLPAFAVLGCVAEGETRLVRVSHARIKETDRIKVMHQELSKMGAKIEEKRDGLRIKQSALTGAEVSGHGDHRVVMALTLAGMVADGETIIDTAESVAVTYPGFVESMKSLGADIEMID